MLEPSKAINKQDHLDIIGQINERISRHYLLLFTPSRYNLIPVTGLLPTVTWLYLLNNVISMYYEIKLQNMETL